MAKATMPFSFHTILILCLFFSFQFVFMPAKCLNNGTDLQLQALLAFKAAIVSDPLQALSSWNETIHFCSWSGIKCANRHNDRIVSINFMSKGLMGSLSPYIGNLSFLKSITLKNNSFTGKIPEEIGRLRRLEYVEFSNNSFGGEIPRNISHCTKLYHLNLIDNKFTGRITPAIGSLVRLRLLGLSYNRLTGAIPAWIGNMTALVILAMDYSGLQDQIPESLVQLKNLRSLLLAGNNLTGSIPTGLFNSSIIYFVLGNNQLQGTIPLDAGHTLRNIKSLFLANNNLSGEIPVSLLNASSLRYISLYSNNFRGPVLRNFGRLTNLVGFSVADNNIEGDVRFISSLTNCTKLKYLAVSGNLLNGSLPDSISNLSSLQRLNLSENYIHGGLPSRIDNLLDLVYVNLGNNYFSGSIPSSIGKLSNLQELDLYGNRFTGDIPPSVGNLTLLNRLNFERNNLCGSIPQNLGNAHNLLMLDLSHNNLSGAIPPEIFHILSISISFNLANNGLTGAIPPEVGFLKHLGNLDLSNNRLSGSIPKAMRGCVSLERLHLEGNSFEGEIPTELSALRGLQHLDLSRNNLSGSIPSSLGELQLLSLNLSHNELQAQVPTSGVFKNKTAISVDGNVDLCGGIAELRLQPCSKSNPRNVRILKALKIAGLIVLGVMFSILFLGVFMYRRKTQEKNSTSMLSFDGHVARLSYADLLKSTSGFSRSNLTGAGKFGSVYRGYLDDGRTIVAVKVLNLDVRGASKTFMAECNALRGIRHRNLVKLLSVCLSIDFQGRDFKALVYEYKSNGSLDEWLHHNSNEQGGERRNLTLIQRLNMAIDIASALEYLHFGTDSVIIHGDLKPLNILLNDSMAACVSDFGLSKVVLSVSKDVVANESNSFAIKGTPGYIAPEYGMGNLVSIHGDLYSFGILLLEMFTKIRPTSTEAFMGHSNLHSFVASALPDSMMDILDPYIVQEMQVSNDHRAKDSVLSILRIGVACSNEPPRYRMGMKDVVTELSKIRSAYLAERMSRH